MSNKIKYHYLCTSCFFFCRLPKDHHIHNEVSYHPSLSHCISTNFIKFLGFKAFWSSELLVIFNYCSLVYVYDLLFRMNHIVYQMDQILN